MRTLGKWLVALAVVVVVAGCAGSEQTVSTEAPERDGFSGQMGVMPGDPSSYGE